eukprot:CAMPEP_0203706918 /NCGR_PEP_ID=MMETSP0091-20130426/54561_1 /ASSEMBLY_ACC=CAM_ASM_001089 /TAXON_ID=426623 /ORGANISM="Chaetoceros affinis, Strain CCMP159" /LENGTH=313 /DNA_ID=CAMNT_0050582917 /DNA_START=43 /DNA_END=984 /DNA_ORIENTATION=+
MFLLNAFTSKVRDRYVQHEQVTVESTAAIPTPVRHELTQEIESALHSTLSARSLTSPPSSPLSSPPRPSLAVSHHNSSSPSISPTKRRRPMRGDTEKQEHRLMVIKDLNKTIYKTKEAMAKMQESENFLDTRIRKYRSLLDRKSVILCSRHLTVGNDHIIVQNEQDNEVSGDGMNGGAKIIVDVEKEADIKKQFKQQEENEKKLSAVLDVQKNILTEIEIMRRKLIDLEQRRDSLVLKQEECEEFLIVSAEIDMQNEALANGSLHVNKDRENDIIGKSDEDHDFITDEDARKIEMTALNQSQNIGNTPSNEVV